MGKAGAIKMMRVLIADDHDLLRDTLKAFLDAEGMALNHITAWRALCHGGA